MSSVALQQSNVTLDVDRIRDDFPILHHPARGGRTLVYLDNAATTQKMVL